MFNSLLPIVMYLTKKNQKYNYTLLLFVQQKHQLLI